jgi:hypothetical protein
MLLVRAPKARPPPLGWDMNSLGHDALGSLAESWASALCLAVDLHDGGSGRLRGIRSSAPADNTADDKSRHQQADRGASATAKAGDARLACRWRGGFRRLVLAPRGLTGLLNPSLKSGTKLFQPYFMNCFNCASPAVPV